MLGTVFDMDHFVFLRRLLRHVTAATAVLFVVLILGEYFVPGTVLPFIDVVDAVPILLVLLGMCAVLPSRSKNEV